MSAFQKEFQRVVDNHAMACGHVENAYGILDAELRAHANPMQPIVLHNSLEQMQVRLLRAYQSGEHILQIASEKGLDDISIKATLPSELQLPVIMDPGNGSLEQGLSTGIEYEAKKYPGEDHFRLSKYKSICVFDVPRVPELELVMDVEEKEPEPEKNSESEFVRSYQRKLPDLALWFDEDDDKDKDFGPEL